MLKEISYSLCPLFFLCAGVQQSFCLENEPFPTITNVSVSMSKEELNSHYPLKEARNLRVEGDLETYTFNHPDRSKTDTVTFYLNDNKLSEWKYDDREELIDQYLSEFVSGGLRFQYKNTSQALKNALNGLPWDVLLTVTDRQRPIIFLDYYTSGIARFASASEYTMRDIDPPAFQNGFYIIKLGEDLDAAPNTKAIEGVILHEIAHRILGHLQRGKFSCEFEREANRLVKSWGFEEEFQEAQKTFGSKEKGDSPCQDENIPPASN